ncbi:MAG: bifunctional riboflavin kinase/FAD synthetase [Pirellula sp.]|jgi:riboflavin kinase/FMN adenylyltransferase|nr:bifunctional riboflavin kinase/FAD synthetase [Pirellula sp.]
MSASWLPPVPTSALRGVVAIGNFDGVHRGHACLLSKLKQLAKQLDAPAVAVTFDPSPAKLLAPASAPTALTTIPRRVELLKAAGADHVVVLKTCPELLRLEAQAFFEQLLVSGLRARGLIEGPNFRFGESRRGDVELLKQLCSASGIKFEVVEPELIDDEWISSTRIRQTIDSGDLAFANRLLTNPYRISGIVSSGAQRGRTIGFPTANLEKIPVQVPAVGVYAARVVGLEKANKDDSSTESQNVRDHIIGRPVALHIGPNPTFGEDARKVEAHVLDFSGDLYDHILELELLQHIRTVTKFESLDALIKQLNQDVAQVDLIVKQGSKT